MKRNRFNNLFKNIYAGYEFFCKNLLSILFILTLSIIVLISAVKTDEKISYIENKGLQEKPILNYNDVVSGTYMKNFEQYSIDQFPFRIELIKVKNKIMSMLGNKEVNNIVLNKDGRLLERFVYNPDTLIDNIKNMNSISNRLGKDSVGMFIPTSIEFYKESIPKYYFSDSQKKVLSDIKDSFKGEFYSPYKVLEENKHKYIYFYSDHHWTQYGASLMYEDFYNTKIKSNYEKVSNNVFRGSYYSKALNDNVKNDYIYSYKDFEKANIEYDGLFSKSLYDTSKLKGKNKYQYFLNGDPAISKIKGFGNGNILIFKDSFAHCYIPFLTKEYKNIYVVDPRYINYDIVEELKDYNIDKVYYIYSLQTLNSQKIFKNNKETL